MNFKPVSHIGGPLQLLGWLALVLLIKHDHLLSPPAWDSVMGVFPPAVFLAENDFNLILLVQQADWWQGGPNVHSLSLFTWLVAAAMAITRDPQLTFLLLHGLTFLLTALSLWWYTRLLTSLDVDAVPSHLAALTLLVCPLVLDQVERLNTEIPLMACHVGVALLLCRQNHLAAALVAVTALAIKLTAVALVAGLSLVLLAGLPRYPKKNAIALTLLIVGSCFILLLPMLVGSTTMRPGGWGDSALLLKQLELRLESVPDITQLMKLAIIAALVLPFWWWYQGRGGKQHASWSAPAFFVLLVPVLFALGVIVGAHRGNLFLPRYAVAVLPLVLGSVVLLCREFLPRYVLTALIGICAIAFALNHNGRYYPPNQDSFSVVERSLAYREFNGVKQNAISALVQRYPAIPAFVTRELHYMNSSRYMGYVDPVHPATFPVFIEPYRGWQLDEYPEQFVLLKGSTIHGGRVIDRLVRAARESTTHQVSEERFESSGFSATLFHIQRLDQGGVETALGMIMH